MYDPKVKVRDSACTPKWLADQLGQFDLDPYSNERSHIQARHRNVWDGIPGSDTDGHWLTGGGHVFVNPPYSHGQVIRAVRRWMYADTCFLLRWDPSTAAFRELTRTAEWAWFPDDRLQFEPPPGIEFSSNPFPHACIFTYENAKTRHPGLVGGTWLCFNVANNCPYCH